MSDPRVKIVIEAEDKSRGTFDSAAGNLNAFGDKAVAAGQKVGGLTGVLDNVGGRLDSFGQKMSSWGGNLTLGVTAPLVALGALAFKAGSELNAGMANVASLNIASERVKELKANVQDMQIEFGEGAENITGGLYQVISAFGDTIDTQRIMESELKIASAGVATLTQAVDLTSAVALAWNDTSLESIQHIGDLALKTVELGKTTLPELGSSIGKVTSMTKSLGISQEEMFAVFATGSGVVGSTAEVATGYRGILQALQNPTETLTGLIQNQGFASGKAMLKAYGFQKTLDVISASAKGAGTSLVPYISTVEGANLAAALATDLHDKYSKSLEGEQNVLGKTDAAYAAQADGINAGAKAMKQAQQMLNVFLSDLNDAAGPAFLSFMDLMEPVTTGLLTMSKSFAAMDPSTQKLIVGLAAGAAALGPLLFGMGKLTSMIGVALPLLGSIGTVAAGVALPLAALYGAYRLNIGGLKTFVDAGLNRIVKAAPLAGNAIHELVAQLTGIDANTYDTTEGIQKFVETLTGSEQAGIRAADMIANLGNKMAAARVSFAQAGGGLNGLMAGLGNLTGGSVEISVKSKVTSVDWTTALGDTSYTYDAKADIYSIDWLGKSGATESYTYDAKAGIASIDWNYGTKGSLGFVYDAKAGIQSVDWRAKDLTVQYDAKAGVTEVYFFNGLFTGNYTATASVTSVLWGAWTNQYNATAQISDTSVLWGTYTHTYNAKAGIDQASIFWGAATHSYTVSGVVGEASVLWGAYTHSYTVSGAIGQTGIAWGAWTHTYNALAGIDSTRIAWGAWTHSYNASAQVSQNAILWGAFTYTYDAKANVTSWTIFGKSSSEWVAALSGSLDFTSAKLPEWKWPEYLAFTWPTLPAFTWPALPAWSWPDIPTPSWLSSLLSWRPSLPSFLGGGSALPGNATGTSSWRGGVTSLGERGWELLQYPNGQWAQVGVNGPIVSDVPAGTKIYSHEDAIKMMGGAGIMPLPMNAAGTTKAPVSGDNAIAAAQAYGTRLAAKETIDAAKKAGRITEVAAQKASDTLKAGLQSTPGLFHTSQVTQQQMDLAKLGVPQNFADDWIRHLTDEVVNGVQWSDADIKDAATRAGIDPSLPAKAILDMVTQKWNDSSLFADKKNLDLINVDAVKKNLADQAAAQAGQANIMAMFGIKPDQVQAQAAAVGAQWSAGIAQGAVTASTGTDGKAGTSILGSIAGGMTPEAFASMAGQLSSGLLAAIGDDKSTANADLAAIGPALLGKISDSWANVTGIDLISKLASAINLQLGTDSAIQTLKDMGGKIFKIVFEGWDLAASGADYVSPMASASSNATKKDPLIPGNATGTTNWRGGLTWVGENGPELVNLSRGSQVFSSQRSMAMAGAGGGTVNNYYTTTVQATVDNTIDIQELAYRVAGIIQRKANK